jgi:protein-tyrosine phosphatase
MLNERHIDFPQVFNLRDMGGYAARDGRTVRWRTLYRSAEHQRMSDEEAARARELLALRTVIDFRTHEEADHPAGPGRLADPPAVRHHLPMGNARSKYEAKESGEWRPNYVVMLDRLGPLWAEATGLLADENAYPAVFHCVTGKDRTGVFAALILDLLDVPHETIVEDYRESQRHMDLLFERLRARGTIGPDEARNPALGVSPPAMVEMLEALAEQHGNARRYLREHGVDDATLDRVVELLLEDADGANRAPSGEGRA